MRKHTHFILLLMLILACIQVPYAQSQNLKDKSRSDVYAYVEKMPEYPGGSKAMYDYLASRVNADSSQVKDTGGYVIVQFNVEKDGSITEPKAVKSTDPVLSGAAVKYISAMPKWAPALMNDTAVACLFTLPVKFGPINLDEKN